MCRGSHPGFALQTLRGCPAYRLKPNGLDFTKHKNEEEDKILSAIQAGATGYVLKNTDPGELASQIKSIYEGGSPISPNIARKLLTEFRKERNHNKRKNYNLTPREKEIFKGIADGLTYREISSRYNIASSTVKKHILHIYRKLEVNSKVEFIKKVMEEDLI